MSALGGAATLLNLPAIRRHLHAHPEVSECEEQTAAFVAERLREAGLEPRTGVGGHGVVADIEGAEPGRTLAIRADMDALPIEETSGLPYASKNPGVMHACGHDGHTTILLGTAEALFRARASLKGRIRLIFQPAEETVDGASRMCEEGVMDGVDAIVALHGWPGLSIGRIGVRDGPMMASADTFDIDIEGRQAHAAYPHLSADPILIGSEIVQALQTLISREMPPQEPAVLSVTRFHAGTAYNIIPGTAHLAGTVRTLSNELRETVQARIERVARGVCAAHGADCRVTYRRGSPVVMNDMAINDLIRQTAAETLGVGSVDELSHASMGAEDFAFYLKHAPGAMFRLGLGGVTPLHTPTFDFADAAIPVGVRLFALIAKRYLEEATCPARS